MDVVSDTRAVVNFGGLSPIFWQVNLANLLLGALLTKGRIQSHINAFNNISQLVVIYRKRYNIYNLERKSIICIKINEFKKSVQHTNMN